MEEAIQTIITDKEKRRRKSRRSSYMVNETFRSMDDTMKLRSSEVLTEIVDVMNDTILTELNKFNEKSKYFKSKLREVNRVLEKQESKKEDDSDYLSVKLTEEHEDFLKSHTLSEEYFVKYLRASRLRIIESDIEKMKINEKKYQGEQSILDKIYNKRLSSNLYNLNNANKNQTKRRDHIEMGIEWFFGKN